MNDTKEQSAVIAVEEETDRGTRRETTTKNKPKNKPAPNYNVIIWNDEEHTYEYVIEMLMKLFGHSYAVAYDITWEVDKRGKGIAHTCHQELAELKRDQVLSYGADWRMPMVSKCSIRSTIEPAPE